MVSSGRQFYIGKHTSVDPHNDGYCGSGLWCSGIRDQGGAAGLRTTKQIIAEFDTSSEAYEFEALAITESKNKYPDNCMNVRIGGGPRGPRSAKAKMLDSANLKQYWIDNRDKMVAACIKAQALPHVKAGKSERASNRVWSDEVKLKMSKSHIGKVKTEEHCANISKSKKGVSIESGRMVIVEGIEYRSISAATKETGIGVTALRSYLFNPDSFNIRRKKYAWMTMCPKFVQGG